MEQNSDEYHSEPTLEEVITNWLWDIYPELFNEYEEHFRQARQIVQDYMNEHESEDIDAHSKQLQKVLEKKFYFLGGPPKCEPIQNSFWN